jgi:hypothetical protein
MLKYLQNYCLRRCPRARPQKIDGSANKMVVFANRLYIDTYLFIINREYLLQRLGLGYLLYYCDQFVFDSEFLIQLKSKRNPTN